MESRTTRKSTLRSTQLSRSHSCSVWCSVMLVMVFSCSPVHRYCAGLAIKFQHCKTLIRLVTYCCWWASFLLSADLCTMISFRFRWTYSVHATILRQERRWTPTVFTQLVLTPSGTSRSKRLATLTQSRWRLVWYLAFCTCHLVSFRRDSTQFITNAVLRPGTSLFPNSLWCSPCLALWTYWS